MRGAVLGALASLEPRRWRVVRLSSLILWCYGVLGDCWSPSVPSYRLLSDLYFIEEESRTTSALRGYT